MSETFDDKDGKNPDPIKDPANEVVEGGPVGIWEAIEDVYSAWHAAGGPERSEIGLSVDRDGRQRLWLQRPVGYGWALG